MFNNPDSVWTAELQIFLKWAIFLIKKMAQFRKTVCVAIVMGGFALWEPATESTVNFWAPESEKL